MPAKKYPVELTANERTILEQMLRRGRHATRRLTRARILLKAAHGLCDDAIAEAVETSILTVLRTRQRFAEGPLQALEDKRRPEKHRVLDARGEARLRAEACSPPPDGREHWTLQLLADRVVALELAASCSKDTVWRVLKKTHVNRAGVLRIASKK